MTDNIQTVKHEMHLREWAERIEACQSSDMSVRAWCKAQGINPKTYYYWLRRVRERTLENMPVPIEKHEVEFKQLEVAAPMNGIPAAVIMHLPNATLEISAGADQQTLEAVLLALKTVC